MKTRTHQQAKRLFTDAWIVITGLWIAVSGFSHGDIGGTLAVLGITL